MNEAITLSLGTSPVKIKPGHFRSVDFKPRVVNVDGFRDAGVSIGTLLERVFECLYEAKLADHVIVESQLSVGQSRVDTFFGADSKELLLQAISEVLPDSDKFFHDESVCWYVVDVFISVEH